MPILENARHEIFAQHFAQNGHSREAAVAANLSPSSAYSVRARVDVDARINEILTQRFAAAEITAQRTLKEIARIAFSDPRDLTDPNSGEFLGIHELSDDAAAAVNRIEVEIRSEGVGKDKEIYVVKKVRQHDKMQALSMLARHFKIVGEVDDGVNALANALADRLKRGRERAARAAIQEAEDAVILPHPDQQGGRLEYAIPGDASDANDVTAPRLTLPTIEADSIALHSGPARPVVYTPTEDDDEDLAG